MPRGRPRVPNPKRGRTREEYNRYMREYMRTYRAAGRYVKDIGTRQKPLKAPPQAVYADLTAEILGDPPIGRRALDHRMEC
jgi:hypothetical protein